MALFEGTPSESVKEVQIQLPLMTEGEHVVQDYAATSLSIKAHPVSFIREKLKQLHIVSTSELSQLKNGDRVKVAGLVLVRQRPGTAKGVVFMTIEDETGVSNLVVFENVFEKYRKAILQSKLLMVEGKLQVEGEVIHIIVSGCHNLSVLLSHLTRSGHEDLPLLTLSRADQTPSAIYPTQKQKTQARKTIQQEIFPKGRNFK